MGATGRRSARIALVALSVVLAGCYWSQPGFNSHRTGYNPHEHAITAANAPALEVDWSGPVGGLAGEVVRSRAGLLHALDGTGQITSVDPSGDFAWRATVDLDGTGLTTIAVVGDTVVVPTYHPSAVPHGCLARFDAADGTPLGCAPFEAPAPALVSAVSHRVAFRGAVSGNRIVLTQDFATSAGGWAGWISTVDLADPSRTWTSAVSAAPEVQASNPVVVGAEAIVVANVQGQPSVLQRWSLTCAVDPCAPSSGSPVSIWFSHAISASADGSRLAAVGNGEVEVLDLATGATQWMGSLGEDTQLHPTSVATWTGDALVVPAHVPAFPGLGSTRLLRFEAGGCGAATCDPVWTATVPGWSSGQPAAAADVVAFGTSEHPVVVLPVDCADPCSPLFLLDGEAYLSPPIVTDGRIVTIADLGSGPELVVLRPDPAGP